MMITCLMKFDARGCVCGRSAVADATTVDGCCWEPTSQTEAATRSRMNATTYRARFIDDAPPQPRGDDSSSPLPLKACRTAHDEPVHASCEQLPRSRRKNGKEWDEDWNDSLSPRPFTVCETSTS